MGYSISEVAKRFQLTTYTIRYYDKLGLLTNVERDAIGKRCFSVEDVDRLAVIQCLKSTGMKMDDIKSFLDLHTTEVGDVVQKRKMIVTQKQILEDKIAVLNEYIEQSEYKLWYFDHIVENGVEPHYSEENNAKWRAQFQEWKKQNREEQ